MLQVISSPNMKREVSGVWTVPHLFASRIGHFPGMGWGGFGRWVGVVRNSLDNVNSVFLLLCLSLTPTYHKLYLVP